MEEINSSSVSALCLRIQLSYQYCLHFCLSRLQSAQFLRQSRLGRQEHGNSADKITVAPQEKSEIPKSIAKTPSVVSP